MELAEKKLAEVLSEAAVRSRRNQVRATLYTLLPVVAGLLFMFYSAYKVLNLEKKATSLREEIHQAETRVSEARRQEEMAKIQADTATQKAKEAEVVAALAERKVNEAELRLLTTQKALESIARGQGDPKRIARESLQVIANSRDFGESNKRWIVIGGDKSLGDAKKRAQRAEDLGYSNTSIYLRQNSFRTVLEFFTAREASTAFPDIRKRLNNKAYIRDLDTWCPTLKYESDYSICQ